ncbi:prepilin-type cleavage/methylation domain-containing protein [Helicobacter sp. MIT 21-1697]|uniref:prepilin-type cleavage/methylation domain-containing protein n=1 Tax=Helicobacter sp. MIT 21-1697 TaxID=2993733 RepID=UPI00224ADD3E|nr:prepilin-type cleavage/methylation domain-containing protein [Helicobacter sp. MIT 21-1697]MCX2717182.1 prepilin-type cleavage/methylation domain-containing protein [Helicobacter sp. MIT 21-1697]
MQFSNRRAFSSFELLCVIIIIAIITSIGVRYMGHITHKQCISRLKSQLAHTQNALSAYYANAFIRADVIDYVQAQSILRQLEQNNTLQCAFSVQGSKIIAHIGMEHLVFGLEPPTLEINPKIFCKLSSALCKDFSDRILDK